MRLISFSEYEAGVLALGGTPFGIIAIGAMPVGIVAIGILPMGLVSFACGIGLGLVNFTCGVGIGAYVRAVGLALGGDAGAVGLGLGLAGERPSAEAPQRSTVAPEDALEARHACWVQTEVDGDGGLQGLGAPVELEEPAQAQALELRGKPVFAKVQAVHPDPARPGGYRKAARQAGPFFRCAELEDATARVPRGALAWYGARVLLVALVVLGILGHVARERLALTRMTRVVEATWQVRPVKSEGLHLEPDTRCVLATRLRSDGHERLHAELCLRCGSLQLFKRQLRSDCSVEQQAVAGGHAYQLRCLAKRIASSVDDDGDHHPEQPGLELDTIAAQGRARVFTKEPPPMNVLLEVEPLSQPVAGEPLLTKGRTRLDAL